MSFTKLNQTEIHSYIADCAKNNTIPLRLNDGDVLCVAPSAAQSSISGEAIIGIMAALCIIAIFLPIGLLGNRWIQQHRTRRHSAKKLEEAEIAQVPVLLMEPAKAFCKS